MNLCTQDSILIKWKKYISIYWIHKPLSIFFATVSKFRAPILTAMVGYSAYFLNRGKSQQVVTTASKLFCKSHT
jgi:hypothetical protein